MTVTIDKAGRVVLPKVLRSRLHLNAGDALELESEGGKIVLRPVRPLAPLKKEHGICVYQDEAADVAIPELIDRMRDRRFKDCRNDRIR